MLSIVIITKNEEKLLPRLLKSIKKQSFKDYEIIVADAKSKDNTLKIAKQHGCRIVKGGLPAVGRNIGGRAAKREIILFLDSDVYMQDVKFLEKALDHFNRKKIDLQVHALSPISKRVLDKILYYLTNNFFRLMKYIKPMGGGPCIFVRKDIFEKVNGFNESLHMGEDHEFIEKCSKKGKYRFHYKLPLKMSVRRLDKEGRLGLVLKYSLSALHVIFGKHVKKGDVPKTLTYEFDYKK